MESFKWNRAQINANPIINNNQNGQQNYVSQNDAYGLQYQNQSQQIQPNSFQQPNAFSHDLLNQQQNSNNSRQQIQQNLSSQGNYLDQQIQRKLVERSPSPFFVQPNQQQKLNNFPLPIQQNPFLFQNQNPNQFQQNQSNFLQQQNFFSLEKLNKQLSSNNSRQQFQKNPSAFQEHPVQQMQHGSRSPYPGQLSQQQNLLNKYSQQYQQDPGAVQEKFTQFQLNQIRQHSQSPIGNIQVNQRWQPEQGIATLEKYCEESLKILESISPYSENEIIKKALGDKKLIDPENALIELIKEISDAEQKISVIEAENQAQHEKLEAWYKQVKPENSFVNGKASGQIYASGTQTISWTFRNIKLAKQNLVTLQNRAQEIHKYYERNIAQSLKQVQDPFLEKYQLEKENLESRFFKNFDLFIRRTKNPSNNMDPNRIKVNCTAYIQKIDDLLFLYNKLLPEKLKFELRTAREVAEKTREVAEKKIEEIENNLNLEKNKLNALSAAADKKIENIENSLDFSETAVQCDKILKSFENEGIFISMQQGKWFEQAVSTVSKHDKRDNPQGYGNPLERLITGEQDNISTSYLFKKGRERTFGNGMEGYKIGLIFDPQYIVPQVASSYNMACLNRSFMDEHTTIQCKVPGRSGKTKEYIIIRPSPNSGYINDNDFKVMCNEIKHSLETNGSVPGNYKRFVFRNHMKNDKVNHIGFQKDLSKKYNSGNAGLNNEVPVKLNVKEEDLGKVFQGIIVIGGIDNLGEQDCVDIVKAKMLIKAENNKGIPIYEYQVHANGSTLVDVTPQATARTQKIQQREFDRFKKN